MRRLSQIRIPHKKYTEAEKIRFCVFLAGVAGFEPTNAAVKVLCLTA